MAADKKSKSKVKPGKDNQPGFAIELSLIHI